MIFTWNLDQELNLTKATNQREKDMSENCDVIFFPIYGQFEAIWKLDSIRIVNQTDIFINSSLLSYKY